MNRGLKMSCKKKSKDFFGKPLHIHHAKSTHFPLPHFKEVSERAWIIINSGHAHQQLTLGTNQLMISKEKTSRHFASRIIASASGTLLGFHVGSVDIIHSLFLLFQSFLSSFHSTCKKQWKLLSFNWFVTLFSTSSYYDFKMIFRIPKCQILWF